MKSIVIINGSGGVGKDTFVDICKQYVECEHISSVDKVKEVAAQLGWNGEKDEASRKFLSDLKMLFTDYNDASYRYVMDKITEFLWNNGNEKILFVDIREPREIDKIKNRVENVRTVLITNPRVKDITSNDGDAGVYDYTYDYVIANDGTISDLEEKAKRFLDEIFEKGEN